MSGSGNDFVVFDARGSRADPWERPDVIQALCARGTGVGADGVVFLADARRPGASLAMRYHNSDGSRAGFCGNATLCVTRLATELGIAPPEGLAVETDAGVVPSRLSSAGPEIDLPLVTESSAEVALSLAPGESRMGFSLVGVPHLVVRCDDVLAIDVVGRGRALRNSGFRADGANVNFVSRQGDRWSMRTYERGVEAETLACGSGAIAAAILLEAWKESGIDTSLITRSGRLLRVRLRADGRSWRPTLGGEGRVVFTGEVADLAELPRLVAADA
jgi:diaminopimelate epimerase